MAILLFLNRVKDKFEAATRKTVVESLALSMINYYFPVYGTTNNANEAGAKFAKFCQDMRWGAKRGDHDLSSRR